MTSAASTLEPQTAPLPCPPYDPVPAEPPLPDRPSERLLRCGAEALSDGELLAIITHGGDSLQAASRAHSLLVTLGGLAGLLGACEHHLERPGFGRSQRAITLAVVELARRLAKARLPRRDLLSRPDAVANYLFHRYARSDQEIMGALYLDTSSRLIGEGAPYHGTINHTLVEPRGFLEPALRLHAHRFVLFHNHPSGNPSPSPADLALTRRMADAGELLDIKLSDHLILGAPGRWVSLKSRGAF